MKKTGLFIIPLIFGICGIVAADQSVSPVRIGTKKFTENVLVGEIAALMLHHEGIPVEHRKQLGGTRVLWNALLNGDIDIYPEYTGTITHEILPGKDGKGEKEIRKALSQQGILMQRPLGFNNTYAMGMKRKIAQRLGITKISDLKNFPDLTFGFTNEFMSRQDGWPNLLEQYNLPQHNVRGLDHDLAYRGIENGSIQVMDIYSTDAEIEYYDLVILMDDLRVFPDYNAVFLYRKDLEDRCPEAIMALSELEGRISEENMIQMNVMAKIQKIPDSKVAAGFLAEAFAIESKVHVETMPERLLRRTWEHLFLVAISLAGAIIFSIPLGVVAAKLPKVGQVILGVAGIVQTIPSLALLVFMIPLLGIGGPPAIFALFLYSLLPIVRNTYTGLYSIPSDVKETSQALGLSPLARLRLVELPLAARSILAGIKTSAVINVGFATLGALIGSGGYGQPILTGIRLDDMGLILEGAIPAAALAIVVQGMFDLAEKYVVSKGLRIRPEQR
ncbi:MAG: ABC transporter permease subunit [Candidatus Brocadiaceae bacterium]|nr:ABC transporter permease subunit [Candidatus Brocadiaceae bacterium]